MKKPILSAFILILALPFFLISCSDEKPEVPAADTTSQPTAKAQEQPDQAVDLAAEEAAIRAVWAKYAEGVSAGDMKIIEKAWLTQNTNDIQLYLVWGDNERVSGKGWPSVKKLIDAWLTPGVGITSRRLNGPIGNIVIKGSRASGTGRANYIQSNMNFVALFKKNADEWRIQAVSFDAMHAKAEILEPLQP